MSVHTPRQAECLALYMTGRTYKEVGQALGISDQTAKNHVANLMHALGAGSAIEAACALGWVSAPEVAGIPRRHAHRPVCGDCGADLAGAPSGARA